VSDKASLRAASWPPPTHLARLRLEIGPAADLIAARPERVHISICSVAYLFRAGALQESG